MVRSFLHGLRLGLPLLVSLAVCCAVIWTGPGAVRPGDPVLVGVAFTAGLWVGMGAVFSAWDREVHGERRP